MHFGENQLSPGLISLSLLSTTHPRDLKFQPVQSSTKCYLCFNLVMGRSRGLRVYSKQLNAHLRLAFATATPYRLNLCCLEVTRWLMMQKERGRTFLLRDIVLPQFVNIRFQDLFHSPHRSSFRLSLTVLVRYRSLISI